MAAKKEIDYEKLMESINKGETQSEIMNEFGFSNVTQLKAAYAEALMEKKIAKSITKKKKVNMKVKVNARGSLVISKKIVNALNIDKDATFEVKSTSSKITLKKVIDPKENEKKVE